jgi:PBSX family phage portal protein
MTQTKAAMPRAPRKNMAAKGAVTKINQMFTFGDPEPVLNKRDGVLDLLQSRFNGRWYAPPIPMDGLTRAYNASPHHSSAINIKRNMLAAAFIPHKLLSRHAFTRFVFDYLVLGNAYLEKVPNRLGSAAQLDHALGKYIRRGKDDAYFQIEAGKDKHIFHRGDIIHVAQPSLDQEIYGVPEYVSALQSAFLNENATLFRRKYYLNGSHAGFILHLDGQFGDQDVDNIRAALKGAKGPGNFRNLFLQSSGGQKDTVKLIPVSQVGASDEFLGIKNTTRDDILAAHRVPPQLIGVVPQNAGGFGSMDRAVAGFQWMEIMPLQIQLAEVNEALGEEVIRFEPFQNIPMNQNTRR